MVYGICIEYGGNVKYLVKNKHGLFGILYRSTFAGFSGRIYLKFMSC